MAKKTDPKANSGVEFIANIDTANEEVVRLTGELATAVEANGLAVQAQKDAQTKFEKDLKDAQAKHDADLKAANTKAEADLKAANDKAALDLKAAVDKATEDGKKDGSKSIVEACAAAGVVVPAKIAGTTVVDDSKVKTPSTATGLQRAIEANVRDAEAKKS